MSYGSFRWSAILLLSDLDEFEFQFRDEKATEVIQHELREFCCDNRWFRHFCENRSVSLASLLRGRAAYTEDLLFVALKHKASEMSEFS